MQACACAYESFKTRYGRQRQIATRLLEFHQNSVFAFFLCLLQFRDLQGGVATRKTPFRNLTDLEKVSVGVKQVEQCCVSRAKLRDEWIGPGLQELGNPLRIL